MISVERIFEGVRQEGLNYGLAMTFIRLGPGPGYTPDDLVREVLMNTRCSWACVQGEGTTQIGMGSFIKGLGAVNIRTEVETSSDVRDPGWLGSVDRWVVDYSEDSLFNLGALRSNDMVRFFVGNELDLDVAREGFTKLKLFGGTRYLLVPPELLSGQFFSDIYSLLRAHDKSRLYVRIPDA